MRNSLMPWPSATSAGPKWVQDGSKMGTKWVQNGSKMGPKWVQNGSKMGPKSKLFSEMSFLEPAEGQGIPTLKSNGRLISYLFWHDVLDGLFLD